MVVQNLMHSVEAAKEIIKTASSQLPEHRECGCAVALRDAIITSRELISPQKKEELAPLIGKYLE
jgi:hypothetical protein